jgi:predicted DCC family thiol-disulfide oxidoreductase YuxK
MTAPFADEQGVGARNSHELLYLYDGECPLCSAFVTFIATRDSENRFRFLFAQSERGKALLRELDLPTADWDSNVVLCGETPLMKSDAFLRVMRSLPFPWPLLGAGWVLPRSVRDWIYDRVARNRRAIFGRRDACAPLDPAVRARLFGQAEAGSGLPLYQRVLGAAFERLPPEIREMHQVERTRSAAGRAQVTRGHGRVSRIVGQLVGFPAAANDIEVRVDFTARRGVETWTRTFAERAFRSTQKAGGPCLLVERFGAFACALRLTATDEGLDLAPIRAALLGIPLPRSLLPRIVATERVAGGRFCFHVEIELPFFGPLVRYRGWLERISGCEAAS